MITDTATERREALTIFPPACAEGLERYITRREPVGDFLTAVLENNFMEAALRADTMNRRLLHEYAMFLCWHAPSACHGSREKVAAWLKGGKA